MNDIVGRKVKNIMDYMWMDGWMDGIFRKIHFIKYKERVLIVNRKFFVSIGRGTF